MERADAPATAEVRGPLPRSRARSRMEPPRPQPQRAAGDRLRIGGSEEKRACGRLADGLTCLTAMPRAHGTGLAQEGKTRNAWERRLTPHPPSGVRRSARRVRREASSAEDPHDARVGRRAPRGPRSTEPPRTRSARRDAAHPSRFANCGRRIAFAGSVLEIGVEASRRPDQSARARAIGRHQ